MKKVGASPIDLGQKMEEEEIQVIHEHGICLILVANVPMMVGSLQIIVAMLYPTVGALDLTCSWIQAARLPLLLERG